MSTLPQRGGPQRVVLFSETSGQCIDMGPLALAAFDPGREAEDRTPLASGGWQPASRAAGFAGRVHRDDLAAAVRTMRERIECPTMGVALGYPSSRGGAHAVLWDPCKPGGSSPEAPGPFGRLLGEEFALETRRFHAARWVSPDLLSGVPWLGEAAVLTSAADKSLPWTDRAALAGTALATAYAAPGAMLPGPSGYRGPVWAVASGQDIDYAGTGTVTSAVCVLPMPLAGAEVTLTGVGSTLAAYDYDGAALAMTTSTLGDATTATLPTDVWYVVCGVTGTQTGAPRLEVVDAGTAAGVVAPPRGHCRGGAFAALAPAVTPYNVAFSLTGNTLKRQEWIASPAAANGDAVTVYTKSVSETALSYASSKDGFLYYASTLSGTTTVYKVELATGTRSTLRTISANGRIHDVDVDRNLILYGTQNGPIIYLGGLDGTGTNTIIQNGANYSAACFGEDSGDVYLTTTSGTTVSLSQLEIDASAHTVTTTTALWSVTSGDAGNNSHVRVDEGAGYAWVRLYTSVVRYDLADGLNQTSTTTPANNGAQQFGLDRGRQKLLYMSSAAGYAVPYAMGAGTKAFDVTGATNHETALGYLAA